MSWLVLFGMGAFVFFGCFIWDSIVDGTFRRKPSDWLGYSYLTGIVMVLGYASKYLDEIRSHPYSSATVALIAVALVGWSAIILWRKASKWDGNSRSRSGKK